MNVQENGESYVYTPAIAIAFHRLLVSSVLSYMFCLRIVKDVVNAFPVVENTPPKFVIKAFTQLLLSAQLLFLVSHSKLFKKHSSILNALLSIPTENQVELYYQREANIRKYWEVNNLKDKELREHIAALGSKDSPWPSKSVQAPATEASASTESLADAGTDEVLDTVPDALDKVGIVYRKWIMGLIDHFASIRVLERVCSKLPSEAKINFSILGLNHLSLSFGSWGMMESEIKTLCKDSSILSKVSGKPLPDDFANKVIEIIKTKIKEYKIPPASESVKKTSIRFVTMVYDFFRKLLEGESKHFEFTGGGHCEAILMAIIDRIISSNGGDLDFSLKACSLLIHFHLTDLRCRYGPRKSLLPSQSHVVLFAGTSFKSSITNSKNVVL